MNRPVGIIRARVPRPLWEYTLWLSRNPALRYGTLQALAADLLPRFLSQRPWEHGLAWRPLQIGCIDVAEAFIQVPADMEFAGAPMSGREFAWLVVATAKTQKVPTTTLVNTALFYGAEYLMRVPEISVSDFMMKSSDEVI